MGSVDGLTSKRPRQRISAHRNTRAKARPTVERNVVKIRQRKVQPEVKIPEHPQEPNRRGLLFGLVSIALIGVLALWGFGLQREFSEDNEGESFFASIIEQIKDVISDSSGDFAQSRKDFNNLGKTEVERLEAEVFPDIPNIQD